MSYAPIIIPTLNRYEHLVRCVESLKKNPLAIETELYISLDYPPSEKYQDGYNKIKSWLEQLEGGFKHIYKFYQTKNIGARDNAEFLRGQVYQKYDRVIFTEDDNEFSPNFLEYMNKGLTLFEKEESVYAICGYRNQKEYTCGDANIYFAYEMCAWGYATWKWKEEKCVQWISRKTYERLFADRHFCKDLYNTSYKAYCTFMELLMTDPKDKSSVFLLKDGEIRKIDYVMAHYAIVNHCYNVFPKCSKSRNWGYDGSGINCRRIDGINPTDTVLDTELQFNYIIPEKIGIREENKCIIKDEAFHQKAKKAKRDEMLMRVFGFYIARKINNARYKYQSRKRKNERKR